MAHQHSAARQMIIGTALMAVTAVVAVIGYVAAGWSMLDAIYMVVITVFGVGYGEVHPIETEELKVFTIGVIVAGCSALIYILGGFINFLTEGQIRQMLGARRMNQQIDKLTDHAIICGFGRIGHVIAEELIQNGQPFVIVDLNDGRLEEAMELGYLVYKGDATDEATLEAVGAQRAKVLATVLPSDAANVFITLTAKMLHPDLTIIARGEAAATGPKLRQAGATHVVLPAHIGGHHVAELIIHGRPLAPGTSRATAQRIEAGALRQ